MAIRSVKSVQLGLLIFLGLLVLLALVWFGLSSLARERIEALEAPLRDQGYRIERQTLEVSGFPTRLRVSMAQPLIQHPQGAWQWSAERVEARAATWNPQRIQLDLAGRHDLQLAVRNPHTGAPATLPVRIEADKARLDTFITLAGLAEQGALQAEDVQIVLGSQQAVRFGLGAAQGHWQLDPLGDDEAPVSLPVSPQAPGAPIPLDSSPRDRTGTDAGEPPLPPHSPQAAAPDSIPVASKASLQADLDLSRLVLPQGLGEPLGPQVETVQIVGRLSHLQFLQPAFQNQIPASLALAHWRRGGGRMEVERLFLHWAGLRLLAKGQLGLDAQMRPEGTLKAVLYNHPVLIDALVHAGSLTAAKAQMIKVGLRFLVKRDKESGETYLELPLQARDGFLTLGPIPLIRLAPVV